MIPPIIHQTWKKRKIPAWAREWHESWKTHHPQYQIMLWTDHDNRNLVSQYAPWFLETYDAFPVHIQRVDAVRYLILYLYGGVYVDLDFECYRPLDSFLHYDLVLSRSSNLRCITNAIMMSAPRHPFWLKLLRTIQLEPPRKWYELTSYYVLRSTGPVIINRVAHEQGLFEQPGVKILHRKFFFPFNMLQKSRREARHHPDAFGAHHHQCTWTNDHTAIKVIVAAVVSLLIVLASVVAVVSLTNRRRRMQR